VHPGINLLSYEPASNSREPDITMVSSYVRRSRTCFVYLMLVSEIGQLFYPSTVSRKRRTSCSQSMPSHFSNKVRTKAGNRNAPRSPRLVIGGGYDAQVEEDMMTLVALIDRTRAASLSYTIVSPPHQRPSPYLLST